MHLKKKKYKIQSGNTLFTRKEKIHLLEYLPVAGEGVQNGKRHCG